MGVEWLIAECCLCGAQEVWCDVDDHPDGWAECTECDNKFCPQCFSTNADGEIDCDVCNGRSLTRKDAIKLVCELAGVSLKGLQLGTTSEFVKKYHNDEVDLKTWPDSVKQRQRLLFQVGREPIIGNKDVTDEDGFKEPVIKKAKLTTTVIEDTN